MEQASSNAEYQGNEVILSMTGITKDYVLGEEVAHVLKGIDLTVRKGEFLAILGPSGSGKSTLMNIIGCLDVPTEGTYFLNDKSVADEGETSLARIRNKEIGFIFQSFQLLQKQTVFENVELPLVYANMPEKKRKERVLQLLEKVQLENKMQHFPNQLSGGQQQRVAIARAIANEPAILLADEPTGALDRSSGQDVLKLFKRLNEMGHTIVMITHDLNVAQAATRIVHIIDGQLSED